MSKAIILDVETSSLYGDVIELAYAEIDGLYFSDPVSMRFCPAKPFDPGAVAVHSILLDDVKLCPPSSTALARLPPGVDYWVGHNISYDWERLGRPREVKLVCTMQLARMVWPKINSFKLSALYVHLFGMNKTTVSVLKGLHNAACDVKITANVLWKIMKETGVTTVQELPFITHPDTWKRQ